MTRKKTPVMVLGEGGVEYPQAKVKRRRPEETHVQRPIVKILAKIEAWTGSLTYFHVPNQLLRTAKMRKIYGGLGVRAGVPDLPIVLSGGRTLWLELKYNGNGTSDAQDGFLDRLRALGHIVEVIDATDAHDAQEQFFAVLANHGMTDFRLRGAQ